jgi:hypothetical protein
MLGGRRISPIKLERWRMLRLTGPANPTKGSSIQSGVSLALAK